MNENTVTITTHFTAEEAAALLLVFYSANPKGPTRPSLQSIWDEGEILFKLSSKINAEGKGKGD